MTGQVAGWRSPASMHLKQLVCLPSPGIYALRRGVAQLVRLPQAGRAVRRGVHCEAAGQNRNLQARHVLPQAQGSGQTYDASTQDNCCWHGSTAGTLEVLGPRLSREVLTCMQLMRGCSLLGQAADDLT